MQLSIEVNNPAASENLQNSVCLRVQNMQATTMKYILVKLQQRVLNWTCLKYRFYEHSSKKHIWCKKHAGLKFMARLFKANDVVC